MSKCPPALITCQASREQSNFATPPLQRMWPEWNPAPTPEAVAELQIIPVLELPDADLSEIRLVLRPTLVITLLGRVRL